MTDSFTNSIRNLLDIHVSSDSYITLASSLPYSIKQIYIPSPKTIAFPQDGQTIDPDSGLYRRVSCTGPAGVPDSLTP